MCQKISKSINDQSTDNLSYMINYLLYYCECNDCKTNRQRVAAFLKIRKYFRQHLRSHKVQEFNKLDSIKSINDKATDYKYKTWMTTVADTIIDYQNVIQLSHIN